MSYSAKPGPRTRFLAATVLLLVYSALLTLGAGGCKKPEAAFAKDVLATVNGTPITVEDFKEAVGKVPAKPEAREAALMDFIDRRLVSDLAVSEGMLADPAVYSDIEVFNVETLPGLLRARLAEEATVSDEDLLKLKKEVKPAFQVSMVVVSTMMEAESALADLKKGASFKDVSDKYSSVKGAETERTVSLDDDVYPVGVRAVLNRMTPGTLSPAMRLEMGYVIFKLNSRITPDDQWKKQEQARRNELRDKKANKEMAALLDRLRSSATIKLDKRTAPNGETRYYGATVNGVTIKIDPSMYEQMSGPHSVHQGMNIDTIKNMLNKKINAVLLTQEAKNRGLQYDPEFQRLLKQEKEKILTDAYIAKIRGEVDVTPEEMQDYYNKNKEKLAKGASVRISRILLPSQGEAEAALAELKAGKDFAAVAGKLSADKLSGPHGGDVGFVTPDKLKDPVKGAISNMKPGDVTGILKTEYGYEILKATDRKEGGVPALSTITGVLRSKAKLVKYSDRVEAFYKSLHKKADIKINKKLLESLKD